MEWNGNGYGTHGLVTTMVDRALGSGGVSLSLSLSVMMTMMMMMLSYPPTLTDTLVRSSRAYTRPLPRVTRVSHRLAAVVVVTVVDGTVCGDRLTIGGHSTWITATHPMAGPRGHTTDVNPSPLGD